MLGEQIYRRFSFEEIQSATNNFDDASIIGQGGFGKVYKGVIDDGGSTVAVKRSNPMSKQGVNEFRTEIDMLSKFRHCHLVSLIGYCDDSNEMILVYEYMIRGTLADHLHKKVGEDGNSPLSWVRRLKICIGAARGLDYLHTGTGVLQTVIHRDVKSSNILIDENWAAKISDFGLSKLGSTNQGFTDVSTKVKGTFGYLDPEYLLTLRLTRKSDVYSFGVVLMEVLCGRPALDPRLQWEQRSLARWTQQCIKEKRVSQIIDPNLKWEIFPNSLTTFVELANRCLHNYPKKRPTMSGVVTDLEQALAFQVRPDSSSIIEMEIFKDEWAYTKEESENVGQNDATTSVDDESKEQPYNQLVTHGDNGGQNDATTSFDDESKDQPYNQLEVTHGDIGGQNDAIISQDDEGGEQVYNPLVILPDIIYESTEREDQLCQLEVICGDNGGRNDASISLDNKSEAQAYNQLGVTHGDNGGNEDDSTKRTPQRRVLALDLNLTPFENDLEFLKI
ncbi:hypothetical protein LguiB_026175 [Lonicera macranthoides]